jgi:hypothetical protein
MTPMKKKLNVEGITNELRGNSAFFPYKREPVVENPTVSAEKPAVQTPVATPRPVPPVRVVPLVPLVRGAPPVKRVMKQRHPFDIYQDQYEALQALALEERKQGGVGSMSAMVREAIDALIEKRRKK